MIQMFNKITNLFNFGNINQTNNIVINPRIDLTIRRIKEDFFDGKFKKAVIDLNLLIEDNSSESLKMIKYQLLLIKANFHLHFRKIDEFKDLLENIESNYKNELNNDISNTFKELKLTLMAFENNKDFFNISKQLRIDTPDSKPQGHFNIVFYLNSGDINKAKKIFEEEIENIKYRDKLLLIGGHIYSNLYEDDSSLFNNADKYYREALEKEKLSFLDRLQVQGFYATYLLNNTIKNKISKDNLLFGVEEYKKSLNIILENKEYFSKNYLKIILETYVQALIYLDLKDEYIEFYKEYKDELDISHYIQYCDINNIKYNHGKIQKSILTYYSLNDLLIYTALIFQNKKEDVKKIIYYINKNNFLYNHTFIIYAYVKGKIFLNKKIEDEIIVYLKENKYKDLDSLLAFIEQSSINDTEIDNENINKLIEFGFSENYLQARLLDVIKLLKKLNKRKEYLDLALNKQDIFSSIIFETLKICLEDENLRFKDFEYFINKIHNKDFYSAIIGNIYVKYDKPEIAYNYYYNEYIKNSTNEIMFVLLNMILNTYHKTNKLPKNHKKIFNSIIISIDEFLLEQLFFLLQYSTEILNDIKQILSTINQKLLKLDIKKLDNNIKVMLSQFYMQTRFNSQNFKELFLNNQNHCLFDGKITYIKSSEYEVIEANKDNFKFSCIDEDEYFVKVQDKKNYHEESLIHKICEQVAFNCNNPNMIKIDTPDSILKLIDEDNNYKKDLFQRYSIESHSVGLYSLADKSYKNYFTLIPYILNNDNLNFNSLKINYLQKKIKKILTFSSIIFLDEIGKLDEVLNKDDIVIQKSLTNWLKKYLDEINITNMPLDISYLDNEVSKFIPFTHESESEAEIFKTKISNLLINLLECEKIDDTSENLPIKDAYHHLAPHIGNQEYYALAYCMNHNYQIISENNIFDMLSKTIKINSAFFSNSISLLNDILSYEEYRSIIMNLHHKRYKYLLNNDYTDNLIVLMKEHNISDLQYEEKELIKIAHSYGLLDKIIQYYNTKFKVLYPMGVIPTKTILDKNIDKLFDIVETNKVEKCKN